ncbi:hypothetical protein QCA50_017511 [Cerrena zonata]|uniref:Uncharacterized protein n=1 Tax=Cerrena zonata TaxID=2478898 RepID=A0AAW0FJF8_9APHY
MTIGRCVKSMCVKCDTTRCYPQDAKSRPIEAVSKNEKNIKSLNGIEMRAYAIGASDGPASYTSNEGTDRDNEKSVIPPNQCVMEHAGQFAHRERMSVWEKWEGIISDWESIAHFAHDTFRWQFFPPDFSL